MLLQETVRRGAAQYPKRTALIFHDQTISYGVLAEGVAGMASLLAANGVRAGDRVGLLLPNCPAFVMGYYAAGRAGAMAVPVNPLLKPAELEYIWRDSDVRLVLTIESLRPGAEIAQQALPSLRRIVTLDPLPTAETGSGFPPPETSAGDENGCAVIIYTSGTTGHPKGAMLSHRNLLRNVAQIQARLNFQPEDRFLTVLPLYHSFAATVCMNLALYAGAASCLMENFAPGRVFEAAAKHRLTILPGVPAVFNALLAFGAEMAPALPDLRMLVSGGAPLPAAALTALEAHFGVPLLEGDGPTECSPVTSVNPLEGPRKPGSVGPPLPGVEAAIFDTHDNPLPPETIGEIVIRGDNVMLGYLNQPEATAEAMANGWYHTGDLGRMDADGYLYIMDRKKDMIITSGLNVYPREIEEVLALHPAVQDSAVIGLPDAMRGEEVAAAVVRRAGMDVTERDLMLHCRERLANYKAPRRILFRDALPHGSTGKVMKRLLKKELEMEPEPD